MLLTPCKNVCSGPFQLLACASQPRRNPGTQGHFCRGAEVDGMPCWGRVSKREHPLFQKNCSHPPYKSSTDPREASGRHTGAREKTELLPNPRAQKPPSGQAAPPPTPECQGGSRSRGAKGTLASGNRGQRPVVAGSAALSAWPLRSGPRGETGLERAFKAGPVPSFRDRESRREGLIEAKRGGVTSSHVLLGTCQEPHRRTCQPPARWASLLKLG